MTNRRLTIEELTEIAEEFLRNNYEIELNIPIERNNRLRTTLGRFHETLDGEPLDIELSGFLLNYGSHDVIIDTLKHECIHYALCVRGEPNCDGHEHFEAELRKHGVSSTGVCVVGIRYTYQCAECLSEYYTTSKSVRDYPERRMTKCCHADLINIGERIHDGTEVVT